MFMSPTPRRHELTDEQWEKLEPLLPPQKPPHWAAKQDHRTIINGIPVDTQDRCPMGGLARAIRLPQDRSSRLYRWRKAGIWDNVLAELQRMGDTLGEVQWTIHYVDGTSIRAHQSAAGAKG